MGLFRKKKSKKQVNVVDKPALETKGKVEFNETDLHQKANDFIDEYKEFGFYWFVTEQKDRTEIINKIIKSVKDSQKWPEDWFIISHDERNVYWFDVEWMGDLEHMYSEFLQELSKLCREEIKFETLTPPFYA